MKQGDVYWCEMRPPNRRRPVVVLTRTSALGYLSSVIVAPITRTLRNIETHVPLGPEDGLPTASVVNLDGIIAVSVDRLRTPITELSLERLGEIRQAISFTFDLDHMGRP